ncbi:acetyl-CoA carboxylase biotin carboxyl carrier protein subunit [Corynebacterium sp. TAE3-ERU12]|uniref:acetyl-CoA carboxylase biotin carboxyl carrier protein subunit n=1 Tax=Corynebacterium sp. TAE3-ERU12 TaxID=2849491 RepID=UPI001C458815|nr:acetyl-CoA carboxylase biotin carboxyl carrier protein subunit [Corynebacterium sp. TAE3-ERU12]MBV7295194.1 acetyl-CoA carboxylase biotin carboxyl carrier protein subunit [Corynebacterium sp. TAE3-ERU12]
MSDHVEATVEVHAPFAGIARMQAGVGDRVNVGDPVAVVEAVKLEAPVVAPCAGIIESAVGEDFADVAGGDVLVTITVETEGS